jgi:hypothetical protein
MGWREWRKRNNDLKKTESKRTKSLKRNKDNNE